MPRYTQLYREAADARSLFVLLDGVVEHTASNGVPSGQRVQRCDGAVVGATGAWSKSVVVVGLEALSRVPRDTTATTLKECVLLRLGSNALSPDAMLRELVRQLTLTLTLPTASAPEAGTSPHPHPNQVRQQLPDVPLFFGLPAEALAEVAALSSAIEVREGEDVKVRVS